MDAARPVVALNVESYQTNRVLKAHLIHFLIRGSSPGGSIQQTERSKNMHDGDVELIGVAGAVNWPRNKRPQIVIFLDDAGSMPETMAGVARLKDQRVKIVGPFEIVKAEDSKQTHFGDEDGDGGETEGD